MTDGRPRQEPSQAAPDFLPFPPEEGLWHQPRKPFAASLLAALALHLAVLALLALPGKPRPPAPLPPPLELVLLPPALAPKVVPKAADRPPPTKRPSPISTGESRTRASPVPPTGSPVLRALPTLGKNRSAPAPADILDAVGTIARQMAREGTQAGPSEGSPKDRPVLAALDKALSGRSGPREIRTADGLIRIRTESGREYCLRPPPAYAGGPVEALSIPTTCP